MDAATLFALSPNSIQDEDFKSFEKVLSKSLCMPVWTYNELEKCRQHVFPELSNKSLIYLHDRVGGVPRSCLEAPTEALRQGLGEQKVHERGLRRLEDAFNEIKDPLKVLRTQAESLGSVKVSGRLLHKVPDSTTPYWDTKHRVWASAYVIDRFVDIINAFSACNMNREVREGLARNDRDGTLGKVFKCYVLYLFVNGSRVKLRKRRLYKAPNKEEPKSQEGFIIPKNSGHQPFSGMVDFSIPEKDTGTIWTPGPNFPSVDIILTPNLLFQVTISPHHPVKQKPLQKILEKLPAKEKILLYFVVPEDIFETFTFQNYHNEQGHVSQKVPDPIKMVEQWVLGVPLMSLYTKESETPSKNKNAVNEDDIQQPQTPKEKAANEDNMQQLQTPEKRVANEDIQNEDSMQQPQMPNKKRKRNISVSNAKTEGLNKGKSRQSKAPRHNPTMEG